MKIRHLFSLLTASGLTAATNLVPQSPAQAEQVNFVCRTSNGNPATVAQHSQHGKVPVIRWVSDYFSGSGYTPQKRCEIVSKKFREYHNQGLLNYLTTGIVNKQPVICVAESKNSGCAGVLFTLKPGSNKTATLKRLMDVRAQAGGPLNQTQGRTYVDINHYIEKKATSNSAEPEVSTSKEQNSSSSSAPGENINNGEIW